MTCTAYQQLEAIFARYSHLENSVRILSWDRRTLMPARSGKTRTKITATLHGLATETICNPQVGELLAVAEDREQACLTPWQAANLREMRRKWNHLSSVPAALQTAIAELAGPTESAWEMARRDNDFGLFSGHLRQYLALQIEASRIRGEIAGLDPYDTLLDEHEPGLRKAKIDPLFDDLAGFLPSLANAIAEKQSHEPPALALAGPFPLDKQAALSRALAGMVGFDFERGRLDVSAHPYTSIVPGDIRITTRFDTDDVRGGIMSTIHESGHANYETGLPEEWHFQPVGLARGGALHESQALIFEMQASRSAPFIRHLSRLLRTTFGRDGPAWTDANILRNYRRVRPGHNRVDADEVTYPLHIILRYRIERRLMDGSLDVDDLPEAWNEESRALLGVAPPRVAEGCLQDPHWVIGYMGYFPVYTLGALIAAQLFEKAATEEPDLHEALAGGDFVPLLRSLRRHVHALASFPATSDAIVEQATGEPVSTRAFKTHLIRRYLEETVTG